MKILITGANGFIGRNLAAALTEYEVTPEAEVTGAVVV